MSNDWPESVRVIEVGPRDGLQNESEQIPTETKIAFVRALADAGAREIEVSSFVHPKAIPQLADAADVVSAALQSDTANYSVLVPNAKGLERALASGVKRIAVFTAASDTFTKKNINMSIEESLSAFTEIVPQALAAKLSVRGYLSTCFVCPYEGEVDTARVVDITRQLLELGIDEIAISDTIGAAAPTDIDRVLTDLLKHVNTDQLALHLHDTYGTALANVVAGLRCGIKTFDSSAGGLGGCPYAPGAAGNLATEDLVYMLERMGIVTGIDLQKLARASMMIAQALGRDLPSRQLNRLHAAR